MTEESTAIINPVAKAHEEAVEKAVKAAWNEEDRVAAEMGDGFVLTPTGLGIARNASDDEYLKAAAGLVAAAKVSYQQASLAKFRLGDLMRAFCLQNGHDTKACVEHFKKITGFYHAHLTQLLRVATEIPESDRKPSWNWGACWQAVRIKGPNDPVENADFQAMKVKLLTEFADKPKAAMIVKTKLRAEVCKIDNAQTASISPQQTDGKEVLLQLLADWYQLKQITDTRLHIERFPEIPETAWFHQIRSIEASIENLLIAFGHKQWSDIKEPPFQYYPPAL
jgi:hypothetical protein